MGNGSLMSEKEVEHDRQRGSVDGIAALGQFLLPGLALAMPAVLVVRALLTSPAGRQTIAGLGRIAAPGLCLVVAVVMLVPWRLGRRHVWFVKIARQSGALSALIFVAALGLSALDVLAGLEPYLLVPGMALFALTMWNRPRMLVVSTLVGPVLMAGIVLLVRGSVGPEQGSIMAIGCVVALFTGLAVRGEVVPSDERTKSLMAENRELWNLSYRDTLTGLYNRRYLAQVATQLYARATRYKEQLHVLMIDIDHFKRVNDTLGHSVGDEVLKGVASSIQSFVRNSDTVGRYGGEEFIVYLVQSTPEITQFIANRIRDGVAASKFPGVPWTITISIGVAGIQDGDTLEGLVERADQFLYMSKRHGRNRVSGF